MHVYRPKLVIHQRGARCREPGCVRLARHPPHFKFCQLHEDRMTRTYTTKRMPTVSDLRRFRGSIASVLRRQRNSAAIKYAEALTTRDLLNYHATTGVTLDLTAERVFGFLRVVDVTPLDVVQRVCEVYALRRDGEPALDSPRPFRVFLARSVMRLKKTPERQKRLKAPQLHYIGSVIEETLGKVALAVLMQVEKAAEERREYIGACQDLAAAPPARARIWHGRTHSHRTHKGRPL